MARLFPVCAVLFGLLTAAELPTDSYVIVANIPAAPPPLSAAEVKNIFSMASPSWPDGSPITLVLPPSESSEMAWLCSEYLRIEESVFRRYTMEKAYREGKPSPTVPSDRAEQLAQIRATSGSISVLPLGDENGLLVLALE